MKLKTSEEQKRKILKAKIALAMRDELGSAPNEKELESMYRIACVLYKAVVGTHYTKKQQKKNNQIALF